jgi:preprotein translocase subunit SecG
MTGLPLLASGWVMSIMAFLFVICSILLILIVLIQKGRGGGLSGALGGAMAGGVFGSKTGDFLTWATIVMAGVFLLIAVMLARFYRPSVSEYGATPTTSQPVSAPAATGQTAPIDTATGTGNTETSKPSATSGSAATSDSNQGSKTSGS